TWTHNADRGASVAIAESGPVDASTIAVVEGHGDDLRLENHLPLDNQLHGLQERFDRAKFRRHRAYHDYSGLGVDDHVAPVCGADDSGKRLHDVAPAIAVRGSGNARALGRTRRR